MCALQASSSAAPFADLSACVEALIALNHELVAPRMAGLFAFAWRAAAAAAAAASGESPQYGGERKKKGKAERKAVAMEVCALQRACS
jgi:hypothetical protein